MSSFWDKLTSSDNLLNPSAVFQAVNDPIAPYVHALGLNAPSDYFVKSIYDPGAMIDMAKSDWVTIKHWFPDLRRDREAQMQGASNARNIVYGRTRVGSQIAYGETTGDLNQTFHLICIHAGHEIDGYEEFYFDDKLVTSAAGGWVINAPFTGKVEIERFDGSQTTASASLVAASAGGWTTDHKLLGLAYSHITLTFDEAVFPAGLPTIKTVLRGKRVHDPRTGLIAWSSNTALCIRDYMLTDKEHGGMSCDPDEVNDAFFIAAANICDQLVESNIPLDASFNPVTPGVKSLHKPVTSSFEKRYTMNGQIVLDGTPAGFVRSMLSACAGDAIYSEGAWKLFAGAPSASVATLDESWLNGGISFQAGSNANDKNNTVKGAFTNSNDYWADTEFPEVPTGASTPPNSDYWNLVASPERYNTAATYAQNSYVTWSGKVYKAYSVTTVPINTAPPNSTYWVLVEIHDNSLQYPSGYTIQRGGIVYTSIGIVPVSNPYLAEDGGEVLAANIVLPFTTGSSEAQRLAKISLEKSRRGFSLTYPCNHKAFRLEIMDVVTVNNALMGMSKLFRVAGWDFSLMGGTDLTLIEYDPDVYNWLPGDSTPLVSPVISNLPDPWTVAAPLDLSCIPRVYDTNNGASSRVDLVVSWQPGQASSTRYQVQYVSMDTAFPDYGVWRDVGSVVESNTIISALAAGNYDVRVRAMTSLGVKSEWTSTTVFVPNPDTFVPNVTGLELFDQGNNTNFVGKHIKLRWNKVTPRSNDTATGAASPATYPGWFRYYELLIYAGSILLRTEPVPVETYDYDYEKNYKDCLDKGLTSASRTISFELRAVATWGDSSAIPAKLTANNAASPVPANITGTSFIGGMSVSFDPLNIPDLLGYEIHASQSAGFTPTGHEAGSGTCINSGSESSFFQKQAVFGVWYVKVGSYDTFGTDGMIYSADVTVTVATPASVMLEELTDQITESQLYADLRARIDATDAPGTGLIAIAEAHANSIYNLQTSDSQQNSTISTLNTTVNGHSSSISTLNSTTASQASTISTINTTVGGHSTSISTINSSVDGIKAKHAVKIDANGYVSGYELISDGTTAQFGVLVDRFFIASPGNTSAFPFIVDGGKVMIDDAYIISLTADKILTGTMAASQSITVGGMVIDAGASSAFGNIRLGKQHFDSDVSGFWLGNLAGESRFSVGTIHSEMLGGYVGKGLIWDGTDLTIRGALNADDITTGTLTVRSTKSVFGRYEEGLRIVRGTIKTNGTSAPTILLGAGFTVTRTAAGLYRINIADSFTSEPTVIASLGGAFSSDYTVNADGSSGISYTVITIKNGVGGVVDTTNIEINFMIVGID